MKFTGKKIVATMSGLGLLIGTVHATHVISGFISDYDPFHTTKFPDIKNMLTDQLQDNEVTLNGKYSPFVYGITVDGKEVSIEFTDGEIIKGYADTLSVSNLHNLYYLNVLDSAILEAYTSDKNSVYDIITMSISETELQFNDISVENTLTLCSRNGVYEIDNIDISKCQNIGIYNAKISNKLLERISKDSELTTLYFSRCKFEDSTLTISSKTVQTIIVDPVLSMNKNNISDFDFNNCPNLEEVSIGCGTMITNLDGIRKLQNLKTVSMGISTTSQLQIAGIQAYIEERKKLIDTIPTVSSTEMTTMWGTYISSLDGLKNNASIETLNISSLNRITSTELLETVKTLPNLKKIVGFEVNNAIMYSDEFVEYCSEHSIEQPFTEKSKAIKEELERILDDIITPDMTDIEKIEAITQFVINHMDYNNDATDTEKMTPEVIKEAWGEKLYYSLFDGLGICDGYETLTHALLLEADINTYREIGIAHTWDLVELDGEFYQLDTTKLDYYIEKLNLDCDSNYELTLESPYYLDSYGNEYYQEAFVNPKEAIRR
jgi:hypothetical protein